MYWHSQGRSRSRRMPKSISVYTTVLLHSSDGLRDERKRNALTLSSIANLHPCINGGRHGGYGRGWRPTIASSKANFCSVAGVLSRPAVLFLYVPHPPPGILDPLPSLSPSKNFRQPQSFSCNLGPKCTSLQTNTSPSQSLIYAMPTDQISAQDMFIEVGKCGLKD